MVDRCTIGVGLVWDWGGIGVWIGVGSVWDWFRISVGMMDSWCVALIDEPIDGLMNGDVDEVYQSAFVLCHIVFGSIWE